MLPLSTCKSCECLLTILVVNSQRIDFENFLLLLCDLTEAARKILRESFIA